MMDQVKDYGGSLAKFMATQSAVPLLSEDWAAIDVFIQETLGRQDFNYIIVVDDQGVVRGSNEPRRSTRSTRRPTATPLSSRDPGVTVQSHRLADGRDVLDFGAPILFQGKEIGQVHLGIYEAPLTAVANLVLVLLAILTLVTTRGRRRRHLPARAAPAGADPRAAQLARRARQRPLRLPDRRDAQGRIRRAVCRVRPDRGRARSSAMSRRTARRERYATAATGGSRCWRWSPR